MHSYGACGKTHNETETGSRDERKVPPTRREGPTRILENLICTTVAPDPGEVQYKSRGVKKRIWSYAEGWWLLPIISCSFNNLFVLETSASFTEFWSCISRDICPIYSS